MALVSPGVEVTVIDESQYIPSAVNTVPYFVVATAQNKVSGDGVTVAAGTIAANANQTFLITSQRDLVATFGVPFFYNTTTGTPINGYELNEYGLLAAFSALAVTNRAYVQRVDVNLTALTASLSRPTGCRRWCLLGRHVCIRVGHTRVEPEHSNFHSQDSYTNYQHC